MKTIKEFFIEMRFKSAIKRSKTFNIKIIWDHEITNLLEEQVHLAVFLEKKYRIEFNLDLINTKINYIIENKKASERLIHLKEFYKNF